MSCQPHGLEPLAVSDEHVAVFVMVAGVACCCLSILARAIAAREPNSQQSGLGSKLVRIWEPITDVVVWSGFVCLAVVYQEWVLLIPVVLYTYVFAFRAFLRYWKGRAGRGSCR